ncbi:polyketide synthase [Pleurocapsa sp. CCALA 161]|uniref:type I polyketide synthase n=1 Tax=Pleurocapsa sp. CCALA 161 TaxID=2107688 RepID=UPI000D06B505|nr:polyketide synthase [Pleurocapsa sp. CCALA 161]PSB10269.1 polyketide synthase [Pleurocapsa sp. CCALA 161]
MELSPTKKALLALKKMQSKLETLENAKHEPIAVVGMDCRFPGANNPEEFWQLLQEGKDAITSVPDDRWNEQDCDLGTNTLEKIGTSYGGFVAHLKEFDPSFFRIAPKEAVSIDPQQRLLLEVSWSALENAAISADRVQGSQTGVFIGIAAVDYWHQLLSRNNAEIDAYLTTGNTHSLASGRISHFFNFTGSSISLDTACSSSLVAVHLAIKSLRDRECNMALAGGVNRLISPKISLNFAQAKMLSPDGKCKTFDESANGFVRSEGCGMVVLKRLSDAIADQDNIRAILLGSATNQDGRTSSITTPSSLSQQAVIKQALVNSKVTASQVSYLETHGTGTALGDAIELEALTQVFQDNEELILGAVKTNIGHLEAAAGIVSLIKTVLALENKSIPANLHLKQPNSNVEWQKLPFKLPQKAIAWHQTGQPRIAGISSFGFSGTNAHLVVKEAKELVDDLKETGTRKKDLYLFTLSAKSNKALRQLASNYLEYIQSHPHLLIEDICYTVNIGRSHFNHRLGMSVTSIIDLQSKLAQYLTQETTSQVWQGKLNLNQDAKLALIVKPENQELKELIESIIDSLVAVDMADIYWEIGDRQTINNQQKKYIFSPTNDQLNNWQILINGLGQLYILGIKINWQVLSDFSGGKKITLPNYPFQRSIYWLDSTMSNEQ